MIPHKPNKEGEPITLYGWGNTKIKFSTKCERLIFGGNREKDSWVCCRSDIDGVS